jgi:hypothetical protein
VISVFGTALATLLVYYITMEKPELIYTLSDPIYLSDEKDSQIGVQQLVTKNIGNALALFYNQWTGGLNQPIVS